MESEKSPKKETFPTIPVIILVTGILWLINELNILTINIPWFPVVLIIVGVAGLIEFYKRK
ncbi:hypothetical protein [uncultured Methanomethylovorans sp.]|uniref:hypothetical protein n=1 Tax=uncultured Methanomethylovorans sp. TaxID=183759 RepID=UPI002AA74B45|nr:hypothetical protein [uncultured Methanomethylovorans sp.]